MSTVETRLHDLERENASLKKTMKRNSRILLAALIALFGVGTLGARTIADRKNADFDIVTARQLRVVDADGKVKVLVAADKQSNPSIVQGYVAVLDDLQNGSAIFGHWGSGDLVWFVDGDKSGNNLYLGALQKEVLVQSANANSHKLNYRLFAKEGQSGIDFTSNVKEPDMKHTIEKHLKEKGTP
ncbi:hypothetical protein KIH39_22540 [Telmatocola sphagniphila]|uniref:Uncharacterized protein n=1 Tax=Telmatocola sphagniphila TaxID=1123043 RepID=A0A8E6B582_9BACT|nr:hypothetical protein [Telmatocola sphagniphila]QVL31592.1 hypothetical protein KIH39_22540 [Telmatocola sphagniphila]